MPKCFIKPAIGPLAIRVIVWPHYWTPRSETWCSYFHILFFLFFIFLFSTNHNKSISNQRLDKAQFGVMIRQFFENFQSSWAIEAELGLDKLDKCLIHNQSLEIRQIYKCKTEEYCNSSNTPGSRD